MDIEDRYQSSYIDYIDKRFLTIFKTVLSTIL